MTFPAFRRVPTAWPLLGASASGARKKAVRLRRSPLWFLIGYGDRDHILSKGGADRPFAAVRRGHFIFFMGNSYLRV